MDQCAIEVKGDTYNLGPEDQNLVGSVREYRDLNERWIRFIDRNLFKYKVARPATADACFSVSARSRHTGDGFTLARFTTTCGKYKLARQSPEISSDSRDLYVVYMSLRGDLEFVQYGRVLSRTPSTFAFLSATEPLTHTKLGNNDTLCFLMPRAFVAQRMLDADDRCATPAEGTVGVGHLAAASLIAFARDAARMNGQEFHRVCEMLGELVLLALGSSADLMSGERSIRAANLARIKALVRSRIADPDLSPAAIAEQSKLSVSYVHNLFRDEKRSLGEFIKAERLKRAHQLLRSPSSPRMTVTDVAVDCGFSSSSYFSRTFSQAFGRAPSDILRGRS
ncbi:MAG TPA: helix-turn-helix domain-containing protein [Steroidobacteraceae bacterium]|jgi:AraC-like DNA-binding protein|nr:helix-turn-helix domain-containing protein [Steroidobacteraceae bacterium]